MPHIQTNLPFECFVRKFQGSREILVLNGPVMCADDVNFVRWNLKYLKEEWRRTGRRKEVGVTMNVEGAKYGRHVFIVVPCIVDSLNLLHTNEYCISL